jgi:hypothetical protein
MAAVIRRAEMVQQKRRGPKLSSTRFEITDCDLKTLF